MTELQKRRKILEEKFFQEQDAKAIASLREKLQHEEMQKSLSEHKLRCGLKTLTQFGEEGSFSFSETRNS